MSRGTLDRSVDVDGHIITVSPDGETMTWVVADAPCVSTLAKGQPRKAAGRLVEGATVQGWKAALSELALIYPDRVNPYL